MGNQQTKNVLFLCTGNSARSILAEAILNKEAQGRFRGFSAGSFPTGTPSPFALRVLEVKGYSLEGLRSKSWDEFAGDGAPELHFIFTVCDNAAGEVCPIWPGKPVSAHWGLPDPAAAVGSDAKITAAFERTYNQLQSRIVDFLDLAIEGLAPDDLEARLNEIGQATT